MVWKGTAPWRRARERVHGLPQSANGASSAHLWWVLDCSDPLRGAAATLEVLQAPAVPRLCFWALQVCFEDGRGERGAAHAGLQWLPAGGGRTGDRDQVAGHEEEAEGEARGTGEPPGVGGPRRGRPGVVTAVNWGGYRSAAEGGGELDGTASALPPALGDNPNTRLYPWEPQHPYRIEISREADRWRATVTDLATGIGTVVRDLACPGDRIARPVVWTESFSRCDDPPVTVRWSDMRAWAMSGRRVGVTAVRVSYQAWGDGGCTNTTARADGRGVLQLTATAREVHHAAVLHVPS